VHPVTGDARVFSVLTWLGSDKAVAMAAQADGRGFGVDTGLYDVEVEELGPAPRSADGTVDVGEDLHDRMEF
jgi:hypothetical protein